MIAPLWRPWLRQQRRRRSIAQIKEHDSESLRESKRLRELGASEDAIRHCCFWVGNPPNGKWRRFKAWFVGDFVLLAFLQRHQRQIDCAAKGETA